MSESLKARIEEDVRAAMRARDKERLAVLRMVTAAVKQREIDGRTVLDDADVLAVLDKMVKQRKDAREQFESADRRDLVEKESYEIEVIQEYMPAALDDAEIENIVAAAVQACAATSMKDMGKVMSHLRPQVQGRADMGAVSAKVKERLAKAS